MQADIEVLIARVRAAITELRAHRITFVQQARAHCRAARTMLGFGYPVAGVGQLLHAGEQRMRARHAGREIRERMVELGQLQEKRSRK